MKAFLRRSAGVFLLAFLSLAVTAQTKPAPTAAGPEKTTTITGKYFPYTIYTRTLNNGLNVIIIPTPEFKDMVTYATPVFAGSRNETEKGKSGLAHLFEHIMFRHEFGGKPGGYEDDMNAIGADNNAWTDYDMTFYHPFTFAQNLVGPVQTPKGPVPGVIELEADRFQHLTMQRKVFETEAGAVLGEYRRIFSFPGEKMVEVMSPVAFAHHPYGHTVIGYREDVENMPKAWDSAWEFFHNYYAPNDVAIVVVGDVDPQKLFPVIEKAYADWKPTTVPKIPTPPEPTDMKPVHIDWEADVAPQIMLTYRTPAFRPETREAGVGLVLTELLTSRSAPLFQKLRYQKQTVTDLSPAFTPDATDPHWWAESAQLDLDRFRKDGQKYVDDVTSDMITGTEALKDFSKQPGAARTLEVVKSKVKNDFLGQLNTTENIAQFFSVFYRFDRDPRVLDIAMQSVMSLTPADIDAYAKKYFTPEDRLVGTLWHDTTSGAAAKPAEVR